MYGVLDAFFHNIKNIFKIHVICIKSSYVEKSFLHMNAQNGLKLKIFMTYYHRHYNFHTVMPLLYGIQKVFFIAKLHISRFR